MIWGIDRYQAIRVTIVLQIIQQSEILQDIDLSEALFIIDEFKKNVTFDGSTPVTAFIIDGEETSASTRICGDAKKNKVIDKLKKYGFIEE